MSSNCFTIQPATIQHIPALVGMLRELFSIEQDFTPDPAKQERGLRILLQDPARSAVLVAITPTQKVVGMVSLQLVVSTSEGAMSAWIEDLFILEGWRQTGIGRALIDEALAFAKAHGASRAQLLVDDANSPAIGFYEHLGWKPLHMHVRRKMID